MVAAGDHLEHVRIGASLSRLPRCACRAHHPPDRCRSNSGSLRRRQSHVPSNANASGQSRERLKVARGVQRRRYGEGGGLPNSRVLGHVPGNQGSWRPSRCCAPGAWAASGHLTYVPPRAGSWASPHPGSRGCKPTPASNPGWLDVHAGKTNLAAGRYGDAIVRSLCPSTNLVQKPARVISLPESRLRPPDTRPS